MPKFINIPIRCIEKEGTFIWDGMVLAHAVLNKRNLASKTLGSYTFAAAASDLITGGINTASHLSAQIVHIVFDPYPNRPIPKGIQTVKRQGKKKLQRILILPNGSNSFPTSDPEGYLAMASNKRGFVDFIMGSVLDDNKRATLLKNVKKSIKLIISNGSLCVQIWWCEVSSAWHSISVDVLINNHDEADTMLLLHLDYSLQQYRLHEEPAVIYIKSVDTDVLVLLIANHYTKDKIYFVGGPGLSISGVWNVTNVGLELGHVADSLLAWHVITGIF